MGRLIDEDDLIHIIDTASDDLTEPMKETFYEIVAEIPTAYDVSEKVRLIDKAYEDFCEGNNCNECIMNDVCVDGCVETMLQVCKRIILKEVGDSNE